MENKLLASAEGKRFSKGIFIILIICGILLAITGFFLLILEIAGAAYFEYSIIMLYVAEGVAFAAFGLSILTFAPPFRKRCNTSLEIYEDHVMAKWLLAKQAVRIEYDRIVGSRVRSRGRRLDIKLDPPFNKSIFSTVAIFRVDSRDAQNLHEILRERKNILNALSTEQ